MALKFEESEKIAVDDIFNLTRRSRDLYLLELKPTIAIPCSSV